MAQAETTYTYDGTKWDATPANVVKVHETTDDNGNKKEIHYDAYELLDDSIFDVQGDSTASLTDATMYGTRGLTKTGEGTLVARVNDFAAANPFTGNVTVEKGTLELYSTQGSTNIGAGNADTTITVANGAHLKLGVNGTYDTGVAIPVGNTGSSDFGFNVRSHKSTTGYGDYGLSNVVMTANTITAESTDNKARGEVVAHDFTITNTLGGKNSAVLENVDVETVSFSVTGHSVLNNSTVHASAELYQKGVPGKVVHQSIELNDHSKIILDNTTDDKAFYGYLLNTTVDKTSAINSGDAEGKLLAKKDMTYIQLGDGNELHVASKDAGGVADHYFRAPDGTIVTTLEGLQEVEDVYVTDQLSGCALTKDSYLMVTLDDTMLPDPLKYDSFTFTMVLKGLDSTAVLAAATKDNFSSGTFYNMTGSPVQLSIGAYKDAPWYNMDTTIQLAAFDGTEVTWSGNGPATVFKFTVKKDTFVIPEPATATLSLLALAGLAARRRRH